MQIVFKPFETVTLRRMIADRIEEAILSGALKEGEKLVERRLASQFGTSLTAVREALIALEADGFVAKTPNAATYVTKLTHDAGKKIFDVRKVLEGFAVEQAARLATPGQIKGLEKAYVDLLSTARGRKREQFLQCDFSFHGKIWAIADNEYLGIALRRILVPIYAFTAMRIHSGEAFNLLQDAQSHLPVLEAIKANDPALARKRFLSALDDWYASTEAYVLSKSDQER
jgi:DNA-binding GntR family transcriptional regulator